MLLRAHKGYAQFGCNSGQYFIDEVLREREIVVYEDDVAFVEADLVVESLDTKVDVAIMMLQSNRQYLDL